MNVSKAKQIHMIENASDFFECFPLPVQANIKVWIEIVFQKDFE